MFKLNELQKEILSIAIPVSLETCLVLIVSFLIQLVVAKLGEIAIGAVGLANNITFIGLLCLSVFGSGAAILTSKAKGEGDETQEARIATFSVGVTLVFSAIVVALMIIFAGAILVAAKTRPEIAEITKPFIQISALSLVGISISIVTGSIFRAIGQTKMALWVSVFTLPFTPFLALILVDKIGVMGAAWSVVIIQSLRAIILLILLFATRYGLKIALPNAKEFQNLLANFVPLVAPLFITEIFFSSGQFFYANLVEKIGTSPLAAFQIQQALEGVFIVGSLGFNSAGSILIARAIGAKNEKDIFDHTKQIWKFALISSLIFGGLYALSALGVRSLYPAPDTTTATQSLAIWAIVINALFMPIKVSNMTFFGTLAAGGRTQWLLMSDIITVFAVGLPIAWYFGVHLGMGLWGIFIGRLLGEELSRISLLLWRFYSKRWYRLEDIHLEGSESNVIPSK